MNNAPCHIEFVSNDINNTADFYERLFGWKIIKTGMENYRLIKFAENFPVGGAILQDREKNRDNIAQFPLVYIQVESINTYLSKAIELGAEIIINETIIPNRGAWGVFKDIDGNVVALWAKTGTEGAHD